MSSVKLKLRQLQIALLMLAAMIAASSAYAAGTLSGTTVSNTATVDYEVGSIAQPTIGSSPTGNTAGAGTPTTFVVDNRVDLTVVEVGGALTTGTPGETGLLAVFNVTNEGNTTQDYALAVTNLTSGDALPPAPTHLSPDTDVDMTITDIFVDADGDGVYTAGTDVDTFIDGLIPDDDVTVFVLATAPLGALSTDFANIRLTATTFDDGSGAAGTPTSETVGADTAGVDVVFGDGLPGDTPDGLEFADDGFAFDTADLTITKTSTVDEDPFNGTTDPKAIPGAFVQYDIVIANSGSEDADAVVISDVFPAEVRRAPGRMGGSDIEIAPSGSASTFCTFAPAPGDTDGCDLTGIGAAPDLEGGTLAIDTGLSVPAGTSVTISFQVEIL